MRSLLINFYADSYQYKEPKLLPAFDEDWDWLTKVIRNELKDDSIDCADKNITFWASFHEWDEERQRWDETEELFPKRVKYNKS